MLKKDIITAILGIIILFGLGILSTIYVKPNENKCIKGLCPKKEKQITYIAIGASETTGIAAIPKTKGYAYLINDYLREQYEKVEFQNLGIAGSSVIYMELKELPEATKAEPDILTIITGPNDLATGISPQNFSDSLNKILESFSETETKIFIGNIPALHKYPKFLKKPNKNITQERVEIFNAIIKSLAKKYDAILVDLENSAFSTNPVLLSADGFHPNNQGHIYLSNLFLEKISQEF